LDEVLEMLDKTAKRIQKVFDETKEKAPKHLAAHDRHFSQKRLPKSRSSKRSWEKPWS
jgi:hypothetical protein